ncbi:MAG: hypothetical protein MUP14_07760 [Dehalococcoidia bacterium]|nr:hypothetical protein [Dehalococcoidia bacterium]
MVDIEAARTEIQKVVSLLVNRFGHEEDVFKYLSLALDHLRESPPRLAVAAIEAEPETVEVAVTTEPEAVELTPAAELEEIPAAPEPQKPVRKVPRKRRR